MNFQELTIKRTKKNFKRKKEIVRRLKCHKSKLSCDFHKQTKNREVKIGVKKLSFWQRLWKMITKTWR